MDSISHPPAHEPLLDQATVDSKASSSLSTPRSLRPGTVPKLDLSPAIALHIASMDDSEEERDAGSAAEEEEEEKEHLASERQAAAMASFDDLSGPEDDDAASVMSHQAAATAAADNVAASRDAFRHRVKSLHPVAAALVAVAAADGAQATTARGQLHSASEQDELASTASSVSEEADLEFGLDSQLSSPRLELPPVAGSSQQAHKSIPVLPVDIDDLQHQSDSKPLQSHTQADDGSFNDLDDILLSEASSERQQQVEEDKQRHRHMAPELLALAEAALAEDQTAATPQSAAAGTIAAAVEAASATANRANAASASAAAAKEANPKLASALLTSTTTPQATAASRAAATAKEALVEDSKFHAAATAKQEVAKDSEVHPSASSKQQTLPKPASKAEEDELPAESQPQLQQQQLSSVAGQQADEIAAQLFGELLSDAVKAMCVPGEHCPQFSLHC